MLAAAGGAAWLAEFGPHTGYAAGVLGPIILAAVGPGVMIAPVINTGTFGVAPQDAGVASATATIGSHTSVAAFVWYPYGSVTAQSVPRAYQGDRHDYQRSLMPMSGWLCAVTSAFGSGPGQHGDNAETQ
jgi:hypothetical protein